MLLPLHLLVSYKKEWSYYNYRLKEEKDSVYAAFDDMNF